MRDGAVALLTLAMAGLGLCAFPGLACAETSAVVEQIAEITDPGNAFFDAFGYSVAMSGKTLVVGTPQFAGPTGLAYVFVNSRGAWKEAAKLTPGSGQTIQFGTSVTIGADVIAVGTPSIANQSADGEICVFVRPPGGWMGELTPTAVLTLPNG